MSEGQSETTCRIPTSSWRRGDASRLAVAAGTLEAGTYENTWTLWLARDERRVPVIWPAGFRARRDPVELLDPDGKVLARGGDRIRITGGLGPSDGGPAVLGQSEAFYAMGYPAPA